ncbi:MAG TPA: hypothetical protein VE954_11505 [Oligoflexus sp.]|uniref:hypothetical protein n=1 Tax=Oligoflexus sp. TaxID=1971216 RepID=UPI002D694165|nr:hypothetical protein [Oligoflexus sp.]HYX33730.1 hypothetical protein [Oligoflexus sp.]
MIAAKDYMGSLKWVAGHLLCATFYLSPLIGSVAIHASPYTSDYGQKFDKSDLVVIGKTKSIQYRDLSQGSNVNVSTDITVEISRVIKGEIKSKEITLTFKGGWHDSKMVMIAGSAAMQFEVGDEDLLFISKNKIMPVEENGKLPIVEGEVFDSRGHQFSVVEGKLRTFKSAKKLKDTIKTKNPKNGVELVLGYQTTQVEVHSPKSPPGGAQEKPSALGLDSFIKEITKGGSK